MDGHSYVLGRSIAKRWAFAVCVGLFALRPAPVQAQEDEPLFTVSAINTTDALANVKGGLATGARVLDKFELGLRFLGNEGHWPGISAFLNLQWTDATAFSENLAGDLQNVSSLNAPAGFRIANAWIAKTFDGHSGLKAGIADLNTEFDVQTTGALFLNASHGIGPDYSQSGLDGPAIFPSYGLGVVGWALTDGHWEWKAGVFEGTAGNPSNPGEPRFTLSSDEGALLAFEVRNRITPEAVVGLGGWTYTSAFDTLDGSRRVHGNSGVYGIVDGVIYNPGQHERAGLRGWIRAGIADARVNAVDFYAGGGLVYNGPWGRDADQIGFAIAYAHIGDPARRAAQSAGVFLGSAETNFELTYSFAVAGQLTIQPDIQYVMSPNADRAIPDALVVGSRIVFAWP